MPADLPALLARLEAATEGSRELDARLWAALGCDAGVVVNSWTLAESIERWPKDKLAGHFAVPCLTTSLDAAMALHVRVLPEHGLSLEIERFRTRWWVAAAVGDISSADGGKLASQADSVRRAPLVVCVAIARAHLATRGAK